MLSILAEHSMFAGRYRVGRCIASGGMGAVYEVEHVETERRAALKVLLPHVLANDAAREQFKTEARVAARLRSEHVVDVLDAGVDEATDMPYLVMELLEGEDLAARIQRAGPLSAEEAVACLDQVARALDRVHARSIVHRDLKPENLFLTARDDGSPLVKVLDFGIAKVLASGVSSMFTDQPRGTPIYMSPEQFRNTIRISPATDIYSLGMVAFTLLVGHPYWGEELDRGANVFMLAKLADAGPQDPASVRAKARGVELPPEFDEWFATITSPDPDVRFERASEAVHALAQVLGVPLSARSSGERPSLSGQVAALSGERPSLSGQVPSLSGRVPARPAPDREQESPRAWTLSRPPRASRENDIATLPNAAGLRHASAPHATTELALRGPQPGVDRAPAPAAEAAPAAAEAAPPVAQAAPPGTTPARQAPAEHGSNTVSIPPSSEAPAGLAPSPSSLLPGPAPGARERPGKLVAAAVLGAAVAILAVALLREPPGAGAGASGAGTPPPSASAAPPIVPVVVPAATADTPSVAPSSSASASAAPAPSAPASSVSAAPASSAPTAAAQAARPSSPKGAPPSSTRPIQVGAGGPAPAAPARKPKYTQD